MLSFGFGGAVGLFPLVLGQAYFIWNTVSAAKYIHLLVCWLYNFSYESFTPLCTALGQRQNGESCFQAFEKVIKYEMRLCRGTWICHSWVTTQQFTQRSQGDYKAPPVLKRSTRSCNAQSVLGCPGWKESLCSVSVIRLYRCEQVPSCLRMVPVLSLFP